MAAADAPGELRSMIEAAQRVVIFTGAGISTESGIPDFRSPGGVWSKMKPIEFQDFVSSERARAEAWRRRFDGERSMEKAEPNRGHRAVAALVDSGKCIAVITQNVDNLHHSSGIAADTIIELHGNSTFARCLSCGIRYELADLEHAYRTLGGVQPCSACGGIIKSATISFGQSMPEREMQRAHRATLDCDLFIVIGSSLVVYPAAGFPELAKRHGAQLAIVNREATPLDDIADLVVHEEIGPTMGFVTGVN